VCDVAVNAADDGVDGACNAEHCSLREALYVAEASPDATRIGLSVEAPIVLASDLPALTTPTTLLALDDTVTLDGAGAYRVLSTSADLTLENLRLANGQAEAGGAILQEGGTLTLERVSFASNDATGFGGAVMASGQVNATECSFTDNTAALGGGAILVAPSGTLTLARSSLQSNTSADGGALGVAGTATLVNCTVDGNEAETRGGGVSGPGTVTLLHCTLSNNVAPIGSASSATNLDALNTVLYSAVETGPLCETLPLDATGSLATEPTCGDLISTDFPLPRELVALPVGAMAAFSFGPFFDAADPQICLDPRVGGVDQSGLPRPQAQACDVGAFELYDGFTTGSP
jgi:CSLREA domain-containing protein